MLILLLFFASPVGAAHVSKPLTVPDILDSSALSTQTDPCTDFYRFSCGKWIDETAIPPDKSSVMHQSTAVMDQSDEKLRDAILKLGQGDPKLQTPASKQILDFYQSCMDFSKTASTSKSILNGYLARVSQIKNKSELSLLSAKLHAMGVGVFFNFGSGQDLTSSNDVIGFLDQGTIGLPEPSYYFAKDKKSVDIRNKYVAHISKILRRSGLSNAPAKANAIMAIETNLALKAYSFDDRQDPSKINHPSKRNDLKKLTPAFDWDPYFSELHAPQGKLNLNEPEYFAHLNEVIAQAPLDDLKAYLEWQIIHRSAAFVDPALDQENFNFWNKYLHGEKKMKPRWKRCTLRVEHELGYALAEVYVKTIDTVAIRGKIEAMIDWIKQTFSDDLNHLEKTQGSGRDAWLDSKTKKEALHKLSLLKQKVGAPERWRNYSSLKTNQSSYLANDVKAYGFEFDRDLNKIGKPIDRTEWDMMPWEFNAYYDPAKNEFVFPFGILQPPSFDVNASDGANLGAFGGGTVGHELTHGYDNNGRQYDAEGNLKDWWDDETKKNFEEKTQCFIKQANAYQIKEVGMNVDGKKTLPENLADQGGVKLGYAALLLAQSKRAPAALWLGKYSENQQYWIAYAQSWCGKQTPERLRVQITTNEHPPEEFRTNGVVMNRPEFAKDFGCKPGAPMAPVNRCSIW